MTGSVFTQRLYFAQCMYSYIFIQYSTSFSPIPELGMRHLQMLYLAVVIMQQYVVQQRNKSKSFDLTTFRNVVTSVRFDGLSGGRGRGSSATSQISEAFASKAVDIIWNFRSAGNSHLYYEDSHIVDHLFFQPVFLSWVPSQGQNSLLECVRIQYI